MNNKTGLDWGKMNTYKIFRRMTALNSISLTRTSELVKIPDFWATLLIELDNANNLSMTLDSLNTMEPQIWYAEKDFLGKEESAPNNPKYNTEQLGLFVNTTFPNADINIENNLVLTPNPASDQLTITFDNSEYATAELEVLDITGKTIAVQSLRNIKQGQNKVVIDLSTMPKGVYFCNITIGNKLVSEKFIKQ